MLILIIPFSLILLMVWARRVFVGSLRDAFVLGLTVCGAWVWVTTEVLSYFHFICFLGIAAMWGLLACMTGMALWRERKSWPVIKFSWAPLFWVDKIVIGFLFVIAIATVVNALNSPPNTWDALTYHMSRVAHWVQNRSVEYYPTHIPRQLYSNPWLEYTILQFQVLSAGDYWASMVQWFCMIASMVSVSLIARQMGLSRLSQWLTVFLAATVPIGIIESTSVQGDYAATLWLSVSLLAFLNFQRSRAMVWVLTCGVSMGLACLSKGTAIIFMLPIICWIFWDALRPYAWRKLVQAILVFLIMVLINSFFIERNVGLFHQKVLGPVTRQGDGIINDAINYQTFTANLLRNVGIHLGTPSQKVNHFIENSIQGLSKTLNVNLNDPRATFSNSEFHVDKPSNSEDAAAAPFHFVLFFLVSILLLAYCKTHMKSVPYLFCILAMGLMLSLVVKWQPWIVRFQLPLFILFAPLGAVIFEDNWGNKKNIFIIILVFIFVAALPSMFNAYPRHLIGGKSFFHKKRMERYFLGNSPLSDPYAQGANEILEDGCQNVGLILGADSWEYPLWALLERDHPWKGRMEHVKVDNMTKGIKYPLGSFEPCQVIVIGGGFLDVLSLGPVNYKLTNVYGREDKQVRVFSKEGMISPVKPFESR